MIIRHTTSGMPLNRKSDFGYHKSLHERRLPLFHLWVEPKIQNSQEITNNGKIIGLTVVFGNKIIFRQKNVKKYQIKRGKKSPRYIGTVVKNIVKKCTTFIIHEYNTNM